MQSDRLTTGLAIVLGAITVVLSLLAVLTTPAVVFVAVFFGAATVFVYYHASGRMANRVYRRVERQARVDGGRRRTAAGPREDWRPPRDGATARESVVGGRADGTGRGRRRTSQRARQRTTRSGSAGGGLTAAEAYARLDLDRGADDAAVTAAYRRKVKAVHPDTETGDEEAFKAVTAAYERLQE